MVESDGRRRSVGKAIGLGLFLLTLAAFFRPPLLPAIGRDLGMTALGLGLLGSLFAVGRLAADFPAGRMSDRVRPGPMMVLSALLVASGCVTLAVAPNPLVAQASMLLLGIGSTFTLTTALAHFARAPRLKRGVSLSAFAAWLLAGQSFGPTAGGSLSANLGWRSALGMAALIAGAVAVAFIFLKAPVPRGPRQTRGGGAERAHTEKRHVLAFIYLLPAVQFALGGALLQTLVPIVADNELDIGPAAVGAALGLGGVSRFLAALVTGQVSDRVSRKWALIPGQVLQTLGVAVFMLWSTPVAWLISIVLVTLGSA
ncbi:MAG: MFS transporter, partial [Acidimicrobiia bacterium]